MTRHEFNRTFAIVPVIMSLLALALVIVAATTGWQTHKKDEGLAAYAFQLLIFSQPMVVLGYLLTADWKRPLRVILTLLVQGLSAALALGALFYFESREL